MRELKTAILTDAIATFVFIYTINWAVQLREPKKLTGIAHVVDQETLWINGNYITLEDRLAGNSDENRNEHEDIEQINLMKNTYENIYVNCLISKNTFSRSHHGRCSPINDKR